ncbi:hypothetical protein AG1IA_03731 [Rhizoctonia solani AG-1 IA]|uniref:Uncharacterized protein n=1 Tax=Thanatephorus cucumeris (strain AG1-IA) TaxID=983506 RepID=L8X0U7_THACA|nr:hypothetical protein AG1IA_03731 [Rhizoctonia solani AG-1 IA]
MSSRLYSAPWMRASSNRGSNSVCTSCSLGSLSTCSDSRRLEPYRTYIAKDDLEQEHDRRAHLLRHACVHRQQHEHELDRAECLGRRAGGITSNTSYSGKYSSTAASSAVQPAKVNNSLVVVRIRSSPDAYTVTCTGGPNTAKSIERRNNLRGWSSRREKPVCD